MAFRVALRYNTLISKDDILSRVYYQFSFLFYELSFHSLLFFLIGTLLFFLIVNFSLDSYLHTKNL